MPDKEGRPPSGAGTLMRLTQALHIAANCTPHRIATIDGERRQTWEQLRDRVARLAAALRRFGIEAGDRVAILSRNSDHYTEALLAAWWAGGVVVPLNVRWSAPENAYSLNDAEAKLIIVDETFAAMTPAILSEVKGIKRVICTSGRQAGAPWEPLEEVIAGAEGVEDAGRGDEDLAGLYYTGGTTGRPKGVMLSHRALWYNSLMFLSELRMERDSVYLHAAPMFHLADTSASGSATMIGATHVYIPGFSPSLVMDAIEKHGVTHALLVPTMVSMLLQDPGFDADRLRSLQMLVYGGSAMPAGVLRDALEKLPFVKFMQGYGQTELAPIITLLPPEQHLCTDPARSKVKSAGRPAAGCDVRIVDEEGRNRPCGDVGEIIVRSPGMMHGYWKMPDLTAEVMRGGWVHTGDGGYMDEDGFVFIVDRLKDMIVTGGENVFSAEVESAISTHPAVAQVAVIGIPSAEWGEAVHAIVVLKPSASAGETELAQHCRGQLANYKVPRSFAFHTDPLPLSGAGKVLKTELRKPYWTGAERYVG